ncbi:MAG: TetR/AcrR family transcriptional regulator [Candidatus Fimisoma sp.]|nr:TetR/AcrR family transcriptional regulator [Candidatus Fimisoma sp.]
MNKQPEITEATRNTFIEAFCELYKTRPMEKITVKELVQKAGYSRATFYNYFKDAYELLEHIENEFIASLLDTITSNISNHDNFDSFVHVFVELVKSKEAYLNLFMNSSNNLSFIEKLKGKLFRY